MLRHALRIAMCTFVFGLVFTAGALAQDDATPTPSVDDAVSALLAQTQQAPTQIYMTQTVQAALEQALTATAQAATLVPLGSVDVSTINVVSTTEIDLVAGPGNSSAQLAPDGEQFVYAAANNLCLYEKTTEIRCVDTEVYELRIDPETIRWSPDSRYVAFTEDFFRYFHEPDIWLWDTTTDTLRNLTDDGTIRLTFAGFEGNIDLLPTWLPDGTLMFLRYPNRAGSDMVMPPEIYTIALDGGSLTQVGTLDVSDNWAVYSMTALGDRLLYVYSAANADNPNNGIWVSNIDGSNAQQLVAPGERTHIRTASALPGSDHILFYDAAGTIGTSNDPDRSWMQLASTETGKVSLIDPDQFVVNAGWSPDGSLLAYVVRDALNEENNGLYITDNPQNPGRMILAGTFIAPTPRQEIPLVWGANNTLLLSQQERGFNLVLVELSSGTS